MARAHLAAQDLSLGLVAEWDFDEGSGTQIADTSGNGNSGTLVNAPQWDSGCNAALQFDGVDDHVVIANTPSLDITGTEITLAAWVHPLNAGSSGGSRVISKRNNGGGSDVYSMYLYESRFRFRIDGDDLGSNGTFNVGVTRPHKRDHPLT